MTTQIQILEGITEYLLSLQVATPIIFGLVSMVAMAFKGITGSGPSLLECADIIERKVDVNDTGIRAEIARLREVVAANPTP